MYIYSASNTTLVGFFFFFFFFLVSDDGSSGVKLSKNRPAGNDPLLGVVLLWWRWLDGDVGRESPLSEE